MLRSCLASVTLIPGFVNPQRPEEAPTTTTTASAACKLLPPPGTSSFSQHRFAAPVNAFPKLNDPPANLGVSVLAALALPSKIAEAKKHRSSASLMNAIKDSSLTVWTQGNLIICLLGAVHFSSKSAEIAGQLVRHVKPDAVFVELCEKQLSGNIQTTTATSFVGAHNDTSTTAASGMRPSEAEESNLQPFFTELQSHFENAGYTLGGEIVIAVKEAVNLGAHVILGDDDLHRTRERITTAISKMDPAELQSAQSEFEQKVLAAYNRKVVELHERGLLEQLLAHLYVRGSTEDDAAIRGRELGIQIALAIQEVTLLDRKAVSRLVQEAEALAPTIMQALLSERDTYMANGLAFYSEKYPRMVAVVGIAHLDGIEQKLQAKGWERETREISAHLDKVEQKLLANGWKRKSSQTDAH